MGSASQWDRNSNLKKGSQEEPHWEVDIWIKFKGSIGVCHAANWRNSILRYREGSVQWPQKRNRFLKCLTDFRNNNVSENKVSSWLVKAITQPDHRKPCSHCKDFGFSEWDEGILEGFNGEMLSSVQSLCHVQLFLTPWTASHQVSLFITNSRSLLKLMSIELAIQPSHPLSFPSPPGLNLSQHQGLFQWVSSSCQVAKVLELQLQH